MFNGVVLLIQQINSESKALNGPIQSSIISGKRSENLQNKKLKFDHPPILKVIKKPEIIQKYRELKQTTTATNVQNESTVFAISFQI